RRSSALLAGLGQLVRLLTAAAGLLQHGPRISRTDPVFFGEVRHFILLRFRDKLAIHCDHQTSPIAGRWPAAWFRRPFWPAPKMSASRCRTPYGWPAPEVAAR